MKMTIANLQAAWKRGGKNGGKARAAKLSAKRLKEIAKLGGLARAAKRKKISQIAA